MLRITRHTKKHKICTHQLQLQIQVQNVCYFFLRIKTLFSIWLLPFNPHLIYDRLALKLAREEIFDILFHWHSFVLRWIFFVYQGSCWSNFHFQLGIEKHSYWDSFLHWVYSCPMHNAFVDSIAEDLQIRTAINLKEEE